MPVSKGRPSPGEPRTGDLLVVPASELDTAQFSQLDIIYEQAFPARLRVPLTELAAPSPRDQLLAALDGPNPVGFAALRRLTTADTVFLRYYGIAADRRRSRLGLRFWQQLTRFVAASGWPTRIAFEVEDPAGAHADEPERQIRLGRISFWERCGAVVQPVTGYAIPALTGIGHPEPMALMIADPDDGDRLSDEELTVLVRTIFTEHYGLAPQDPLIAEAVASIGSGRG